LPAALRILSIDTEKAKDQFHYRIQLALDPETRNLPGAAFLHADTGLDYVAQILAEEKQLNDKGHEEWTNPHSRPNHLLDAEILAAVCVEMEFPGGGLRLLAGKPPNEPGLKRRIISKGIGHSSEANYGRTK
jgi:phage terminase large subunit GpA-like protein